MRVFLIGLGGAGSKVAYQFYKEENVYGVLFDTDLASLSHLKYRYRAPLGESILSGEGTQKDLKLGIEVLQSERFSLIEKIMRVKEDVDCYFVISAPGGGTGGAVSILLEEMKKNFIEPVYYIALLPSEEDLGIISVNAAKGLKEAVKYCDAFFPIDMDGLKTTTRLKGNFQTLNYQIYKYFRRLFQIGEFKGKGDIGENTVDISDLKKTLSGLSIVGFEEQNLGEEPNSDKPEAVIDLTRRASGKTTLHANLKDVIRALVVVLGDRDHIDFLGSIPARLWVEKHTAGKEVRGGDMPLSKKGTVEVLVILSEIKKSKDMADFYTKVDVLEKSQGTSQNLSELLDEIGSIRSKIIQLQDEVEETYSKLKGTIK